MKRRVKVRRTEVVCPQCGEGTMVQVFPALYVMGTKVREAGVLFTVRCSRHCGRDVPVHGGDVRRAA